MVFAFKRPAACVAEDEPPIKKHLAIVLVGKRDPSLDEAIAKLRKAMEEDLDQDKNTLLKNFFSSAQQRAFWNRLQTKLTRCGKEVQSSYEGTKKERKVFFYSKKTSVECNCLEQFEEEIATYVEKIQSKEGIDKTADWISWGELCNRITRKDAVRGLKVGKSKKNN